MGDASFCKNLDDNPTFASYPASYINDPYIIGKNDNFVSVNSAIEVDFFGDINAEFLSDEEFSGTGGHADFVRGSFLSKRGKSIIAMTSTTNSGISKIVPKVSRATTTRMDADYIVTEYGIERLRGKSLTERTHAVIRIAHPDHRDELRKIAKSQKLI
ncbi:acetyl-CoA hydrolase/transferase C-terminal domain-containing protein [Francisella sp. 19X1-34]|uniref:acetyl-CoA hydrolase/transferase C-terminal domain-containing protein n=1 Tax=Francisella sp. 19X1-34 TaxID=3087177 RepID=UPI002E33CF59|nr:acetyl-CoA hydrolase/transferase C-terminal domain-containing protein [Francisella sp. 19X1-34]MED7789261.1 acetyl-CoA hydrolase/transferase C-terminal domain-containing protein [Francisella sp. 19X1-34]